MYAVHVIIDEIIYKTDSLEDAKQYAKEYSNYDHESEIVIKKERDKPVTIKY